MGVLHSPLKKTKQNKILAMGLVWFYNLKFIFQTRCKAVDSAGTSCGINDVIIECGADRKRQANDEIATGMYTLTAER